MSEQSTTLFAEFSPPSYEEWVEATVKSLKGRPFATLTSHTAEGIEIRPFYTQADLAESSNLDSPPGQPPYRRGTRSTGYLNRPWLIAQPLAYNTPQQFNQALLADLKLGQTAVYLNPNHPAIHTLDALAAALNGVVFAAAPILIAGTPAILPLLAQFMQETKQAPATLQGGLLYDPLAQLVRQGTANLATDYKAVGQQMKHALVASPQFTTLAVDTTVYHNGGANAVQELAVALATGVHHIRTLQEQQLTLEQISSQLRFIFAIGGDFFMEIAKLRAARQLWAQVIAAFGGDAAAQKMIIHGETAETNKSRLDPYVNMLRTTTESLAAAVGGVDSLLTAPFNHTFANEPDDVSRRVARNQQIILQEEANLTQLIDPAGGSYYAEWLTDQMAQKAWAHFQKIEAAGGIVAALQAGLPQKWVGETAVARTAQLAKRKDVLVGVNQYANVSEPLSASSQQSPISNLQSPLSSRQITPIKPIRLADPFEALRDWADGYAKENGRRPQLFLANMGPLRQHKARADFTRGFFEVGGFSLIDSAGFETAEAAAQAALDSGAQAVVICSTDDTYPDIVPPFMKKIKNEREETAVILAGYPKDQIEAHKAAGIDAFIHLGADCLALNQWLQEKIGERPN